MDTKQEISTEYMCDACLKRGKTWQGSDPRCGFEDTGVFRSGNGRNWNCATLNRARELIMDQDGRDLWNDDNHCGMLLLEDGDFLVLSWYKHRGCTEGAWVVSGSNMRPAVLSDFARIYLND